MAKGRSYGTQRNILVDHNQDPIGVTGNPLVVDVTQITPDTVVADQGEPNTNDKAWPVKMQGAGTAIVTDVPVSAAPVVLKVANAARLSITIYNDSNRPLTLKCGSGVTGTSRTTKVPPQMEWFPDVRYTGVIEGFWAAGATGSAAVTEYTL
jgi:hypothetical protein